MEETQVQIGCRRGRPPKGSPKLAPGGMNAQWGVLELRTRHLRGSCSEGTQRCSSDAWPAPRGQGRLEWGDTDPRGLPTLLLHGPPRLSLGVRGAPKFQPLCTATWRNPPPGHPARHPCLLAVQVAVLLVLEDPPAPRISPVPLGWAVPAGNLTGGGRKAQAGPQKGLGGADVGRRGGPMAPVEPP